MDRFVIVAVVAALLGLAVGDTRSEDGAPTTVRRLTVPLAVSLATTVALVFVTGLGGPFELAAHLSRFVFLVAPAVLIGTAVRRRAFGTTRPSRVLLGGATALVLVGGYGLYVEPMWLRVDHQLVTTSMSGDTPIRLALLADLQTNGVGDHEREAVRALVSAQPDIVVIAGDLFQGTDAEFAAARDELRGLLAELQAPHGVFFVEGDSDRWDRATALLDGTGVVRLDNEIAELDIDGQVVRIGGNRVDYETAPAAAMRARLASSSPSDLVLLVSHRPDAVLDLPPSSAVDLTLAGHTHGGQVVVPGFGPLVTYTDVPRDVARGGLHDVAGNRIYVSTGVGVERAPAPRLRFFSRPSVTILDLAPTGASI